MHIYMGCNFVGSGNEFENKYGGAVGIYIILRWVTFADQTHTKKET